jgi:tripartite-type tricarboxylate transporter receptor subunit TctC
VASGGFRALGVTGTDRLKMAPEAPVFAELGYRNFEPKGWFGFFLPAGTPPAVVRKLADDIGRAVRLPDISARIEDLGQTPVGGTPEQFAAVIRNDGPLYAKLIKDLNIKLD